MWGPLDGMRIEDTGYHLDTHGVRYRMRDWRHQGRWIKVYILDAYEKLGEYDSMHLDIHPDTVGHVRKLLRNEAR